MSNPGPDRLTLQQQRFVSEYLVDGCGGQAAIRAGYSPQSAYSTASRLLKQDKIQRAIRQIRAAKAQELDITVDRVVRRLAGIAFASVDLERVTPDQVLRALDLLGRYLGLYEQPAGEQQRVNQVNYNTLVQVLQTAGRHINDLVRLTGERADGQADDKGQAGQMDDREQAAADGGQADGQDVTDAPTARGAIADYAGRCRIIGTTTVPPHYPRPDGTIVPRTGRPSEADTEA